LLVSGASALAQTSFYVATNGSDSNAGTLAAPFLTLAKAQSAEQAAGTGVHRNIYIRGGEYFNVTMLVSSSDSSTAWIGYPGDPPAILYGGQRLSNWTATSNGWWQAQLPAFPSGSLNSSVNEMPNWEVRMLLVDGQMALRAQYPTNGSSLTYTNVWEQTDNSYFNYQNNDIPATMVASNAEAMIDWSWDSTTIGVSSIVPATKTINLTFPSVRGFDYIPDIQTYRIYNTVEGMSTPGQFYFDRVNHIVVYYPIGGKNPNTSEIIVPTTDRMWYFNGYFSGANNVTFSNLSMKVCAVDREQEGNLGYLWNHMSLIHLGDNAAPANVTVRNCTLGWCGGNAIGGDYTFPTNTTVRDSEIGYCGASGAVICWGVNTVVSNNYIHDIGLITWECPGVRVVTNAIVIQNNIFNCTQSAIAGFYVDNCKFLYNSISNCMQRNEDVGAYYQYFGPGAPSHPHGNLIQSNLFQMVGTHFNVSGADERNFYRPAIYLDQESSNTVIANNVIISCPTPVFINQSGSNAVINNVFINTNVVHGYYGLRQYISSDSSLPNSSRNNVYYTTTNFVIDNPAIWTWSDDVFWSTAGLNSGLPSGATAENPELTGLCPGNLTYQSGSPCPGMGMACLTFTQQALGVGDGAALTPAVITWAAPAGIAYGTALGSSQLNATANVPGTFAYSPASGAVLSAGNQTLSVTFTPSNTASYSGASATVSLSVSPAPLTITANNLTMLLGGPLPALTASYSGFVNGDTAASLTTQPNFSTTATASSPVGAYPITASGAANPNYTISYVSGTLTVTATQPTQPVLTWATPASITYGTALGANQLNATANVPGTFAYSPASGTALPAGLQTLSVTFTPSNTTLYTVASATVAITVQKAPLTITANNLTMALGGPLPGLTASYLGFVNGNTASNLTAPVTLSTTATASSPAGTYPITASGAGSSNYTISYVSGTLTVTAAQATPPVLTWNALSNITYGVSLGTNELNATANVAGSYAYSPPFGTVLPAGAQTLSVIFTPSNSVLYTGATDTVAIAVEKAPLTITASNLSKVYGAPFPTLTYRCAGFVNGDTEASLTTPVCTGTAARTNSSVGAYWIATGCAASPNYTITFISAALTVTPAPLTITANNQSMSVGGSLPTLTASYYGFVLGNTVSNLTKQPTLTTTATSSSPAGTYPITVSGAVDANYSISYVAGTLTVSSTSQKAAGALAASSTAQIVVNSSVSITAVALLPSGQIQISLSGQAGQAYVLDASSDLMNWTPFATNTLSQASDTYVDQVLPSTMARFYRVDLSNP
jgi:hypothetical protein